MQTTPHDIAEWLAIDPNAENRPVRIFTRSGSLEGDLLGWVRPSGRDRLQAEPFFVIPPALVPALLAGLPRLPATAVRHWKDIPKVIGTVTGHPEVGDHLAEVWSSWIQPGVQVFDVLLFPEKPPNYEAQIAPTLYSEVLNDHGIDPNSSDGETARRLFVEAYRVFKSSGWRRGDLTVFLENELPPPPSLIRSLIQHQFDVGICRARGAANGTDHEAFSDAIVDEKFFERHIFRLLTDDNNIHQRAEIVDIDIPPELAIWLQDCEYGGLRRHVRHFREQWLADGELDSLKRLAESVVDFMAKDPSAPLPKPAPIVVKTAHLVSYGAIAAGAVALWKQTPAPGWLNAVLTGGGLVGTYSATRNTERWIENQVKRRTVHQLVQTIRRRQLQ